MAECEHCGKEVDDDSIVECDNCGKIICSDCLSEEFMKCPDCGSTIQRNLEEG